MGISWKSRVSQFVSCACLLQKSHSARHRQFRGRAPWIFVFGQERERLRYYVAWRAWQCPRTSRERIVRPGPCLPPLLHRFHCLQGRCPGRTNGRTRALSPGACRESHGLGRIKALAAQLDAHLGHIDANALRRTSVRPCSASRTS